jgi:hypothetical protein
MTPGPGFTALAWIAVAIIALHIIAAVGALVSWAVGL